jgi:hypothetical protein
MKTSLWGELAAALKDRFEDLALQLLGKPTTHSGGEWRYGTKGSLAVQVAGDKRGTWFDHEAGEGGGPVALIERRLNLDRPSARAWARQFLDAPVSVHSSRMQSQLSGRRRTHWRHQLDPSDDEARKVHRLELAHRLWNEAVPAAGTDAEVYLRGRSITAGFEWVRFHTRVPVTRADKDSGHPPHPAALFRASNGALQAVFLKGREKASHLAVRKMTIGPIAGHFVLLQEGDGLLILAEGPETALSIVSAGVPGTVAAVLGSSNFRAVATASTEPRLLLVGDGDKRDAPARQKLREAAQVSAACGKTVHMLELPQDGRDLNDILQRAGPTEVRRLIEEVLATPWTDPEPSGTVPETLGDEPVEYEERNGRLYWLRTTKDGESIPQLLANFTARIIAQVEESDGLETDRTYKIQVGFRGRDFTFTVPADDFAALGWIARELDAAASLEPGQLMKERTAHAIRRLSGEIPTGRVFRHTGWSRIDSTWYYFTHGSAIGPAGLRDDITVELPADLQRYNLPAPPEGPSLITAIRACLSFLEVADHGVSFGLLGATFRAVLGDAGFTVWLEGASGEQKTALAVVIQQHWGASFAERALPGSWTSTANALEEAAFTLKDALQVVDDFAPSSTRADADKMASTADRLLRAQGNGSARGRLRADGSRRPGRPPRGMILATAEDLPRGNSIRGRTLVLEVAKGSVRLDRLSTIQQLARDGILAQALAGFVRWLAGRFDELRASLRAREEAARQRFRLEHQHSRGAPNLAAAFVGFDVFLAFAVDAGTLTTEQTAALRQEAEESLLHVGRGQAVHHADSDPARRFVRLLRSSLASGRAHLTAFDGKPPVDAWRFGWATDGPQPRAVGERLGWILESDVFLEPTAAYRVAMKMANEEGEPLGLGAKTISKRLWELGYLASAERSRGKNTARKSIGGQQCTVLHLRAGVLLGSEEPESAKEIGQSAYQSALQEAAPHADSSPTRPISPISAHERDGGAEDNSDPPANLSSDIGAEAVLPSDIPF